MSLVNFFFHKCYCIFQFHYFYLVFPGDSGIKNLPANAGDVALIPGSGISPGRGNGNPLQYSCLENSMDRGAWWATVYGVTKSQTQLSTHTHTFLFDSFLELLSLIFSFCLYIIFLISFNSLSTFPFSFLSIFKTGFFLLFSFLVFLWYYCCLCFFRDCFCHLIFFLWVDHLFLFLYKSYVFCCFFFFNTERLREK